MQSAVSYSQNESHSFSRFLFVWSGQLISNIGSGLMQMAESSKYIISPLIAGFLLKIMDIKELLVLDTLTFLIAIFSVLGVKINSTVISREQSNPHFFHDLREGFNYLFNNHAILLLISIISFITFFIGLLQALLGPMILSLAEAQTFGIIQAVATAGMLIGSCFIGIFGKFKKKIPILTISLIMCGIFFSLLGLSPNLIAITSFGFLFFLILPFVNTCLDVLVRSNVENYIQGRIWSMVSLISQLGMVIAFGMAGYLADAIFNPLLQPHGFLTTSVGTVIGVGAGRGIGLMFVMSGLFVAMTAIVIGRLKLLRDLEISS